MSHVYRQSEEGYWFFAIGLLNLFIVNCFFDFYYWREYRPVFGLYPNQDTVPEINDNLIPQNSIDPMIFYSFIPMLLLFITGIIYLVYWIFQAEDANRLAKKFNRHLDKEGTVLWY